MSKTETDVPQAGTAAIPAKQDSDSTDLASAASKSAGKAVWMGTAVGIGSAAIVAALLYTRSTRKK